MVFQDGLVVVPDSDWILHLDKENIVHTWMLKVMNTCRSKHGEVFVFVNFCFNSELPLNKEVIYCLAQIRTMSFIVIGNVFIACLYFKGKSDQFVYVQLCSPQHVTPG